MAVNPIKPLSNINLDQVKQKYQQSSNKGAFQDILKNALTDIDTNVNTTDNQLNKILSGSSEDLDEYIINLQKAEMTLDLTLQVRNKIVDAYKEIMRMQI